MSIFTTIKYVAIKQNATIIPELIPIITAFFKEKLKYAINTIAITKATIQGINIRYDTFGEDFLFEVLLLIDLNNSYQNLYVRL